MRKEGEDSDTDVNADADADADIEDAGDDDAARSDSWRGLVVKAIGTSHRQSSAKVEEAAMRRRAAEVTAVSFSTDPSSLTSFSGRRPASSSLSSDVVRPEEEGDIPPSDRATCTGALDATLSDTAVAVVRTLVRRERGLSLSLPSGEGEHCRGRGRGREVGGGGCGEGEIGRAHV